MTIQSLSPKTEDMINDYIENFVNKYANGYQMFNEQNAHGNGTIEDLSVLSWMYYEGICTTEEELSEEQHILWVKHWLDMRV